MIPARAKRWPRPAGRSVTIAEFAGRQPQPLPEPVGQRDVVRVHRRDADDSTTASEAAVPDPVEPGGGDVEPAGVLRPVAAAARSTSRPGPRRRTSRRAAGRSARPAPAARRGTPSRAAPSATCTPRTPARRPARRARQPAHGLRRVGDGHRPVRPGPPAIAAQSATSPVADCTTLYATAVTRSSIASTSRSDGAVTHSTPRPACTR